MCGRFVASRPVEDIARLLEVDVVDVPPELVAPRWNVAPQATCAGRDRAAPRAGAKAPFGLPLGARTLVGQGPHHRGPGLQREGGDL